MVRQSLTSMKIQVNGTVDADETDATLRALGIEDENGNTVALSPTPFAASIGAYTAQVARDVAAGP